jgi:hypothetical protein
MRFYTQKFPEVDDLVMVQVKQIAGASLELPGFKPPTGIEREPGRLTVLALDARPCRSADRQRWVPTSSSCVRRRRLHLLLELPSGSQQGCCVLTLCTRAANDDRFQLEYDNIEGMILLSELSRRRIRSIQKLIRVGRNEVVVVLRVDKEKGASSAALVLGTCRARLPLGQPAG